jgi:hypothetical protein
VSEGGGAMGTPTDAKTWTPDQVKLQAWLALPSAARQPSTQKALAKELGHDPATLSDWKRLPGFHDAVYQMALAEVRGDLGPILHAHAKLARTNLDSAKWLFEVTGVWTPKQQQQSDSVIRVEYVNADDDEA